WGGDSTGLRERARGAAERLRTLVRSSGADGSSGPAGAPVGHLHRHAADGRLPLMSAIHPVTGDQLLTTNRWEAVDLGYGDPELLGYLEAEAPVTGRLGIERPHTPWAARFGQRVRAG